MTVSWMHRDHLPSCSVITRLAAGIYKILISGDNRLKRRRLRLNTPNNISWPRFLHVTMLT